MTTTTAPDPAAVCLAMAAIRDHRISTAGGLCSAASCWTRTRPHPCHVYQLAREVLDKAGVTR